MGFVVHHVAAPQGGGPRDAARSDVSRGAETIEAKCHDVIALAVLAALAAYCVGLSPRRLAADGGLR